MLTCNEPGQVAIADDSNGAICVDCGDSRVPGSSPLFYYGSASFAIDEHSVCAASSCLAGYGLQPQVGTATPASATPASMCQRCSGPNEYSPGGTSACLTCPVQPTDNTCTTVSMAVHARTRRTLNQAEKVIAARQYKYRRQEEGGRPRRKILRN